MFNLFRLKERRSINQFGAKVADLAKLHGKDHWAVRVRLDKNGYFSFDAYVNGFWTMDNKSPEAAIQKLEEYCVGRYISEVKEVTY